MSPPTELAPNMTSRIGKATELLERHRAGRARIVHIAGGSWTVNEHQVTIHRSGSWTCDCAWGEHHSGEPVNCCKHVIACAALAEWDLEPFVVNPTKEDS